MSARDRILHRAFSTVVAGLLALSIPSASHAGADKAGTTAANFLSVGPGPRIIGMGGATLGFGQDLAAGSWNPAALGWMERGSIAVSHAPTDEESAQEWVGFGGRFGKSGTAWSLSGLYQGEGGIEGRDASNNSTGSILASSIAIGAHLSQRLGSMFTIGLGVKTVHEKLADVTGSGLTFDGGVMFRRGMIGAGIAAQNVTGRMSYGGAMYPFPANYGVGVSLTEPRTGLSFAFDANFPNAYYSDLRTGLEWRWKQMLAVRTGYRHEMGGDHDPLTGPTFGLGAGTNGYWFDYGYLISGESGGEHRLALTFYPGKWGGLGGDPFGQGEMPTEFGKPGEDLIGPPVPKSLKQ